jgi:tRNA(fMet)-specific endonuclease VapC
VRYLLDTNVCIDFLNGRYPSIVERVRKASSDDLCTSGVVAVELRCGADRSAHPKRNHARLDILLSELSCSPFDESAARVAGAVRAQLEKAGTTIGPYDTLIAGHTLHLGLTLVTDNEREFRRVRRLRVENWREA